MWHCALAGRTCRTRPQHVWLKQLCVNVIITSYIDSRSVFLRNTTTDYRRSGQCGLAAAVFRATAVNTTDGRIGLQLA